MTKTRARASAKPEPTGVRSWRALEFVLLAFCLIVMALRATYTEAPTVSASPLPGNLSDTVYSLTLSGLLIGALVLWLVWGICLGRIRYRFTGIEIGFAVFLLAGVVSAFGATDKRLAISHITMLAGPVAAAILLVQTLDSITRVRMVLLVVAALGVVSGYRCIEQIRADNEWMIEEYEKDPEAFLAKNEMTFDPDSLQHFMFEHRLYSRDISGFFTTSNSAASFSLLASFAAFTLLLLRWTTRDTSRTSRGHPLLYPALGTAIVVGGLLSTKSKGGILGFLVAASLFGLWLLLRHWLAARRKTAVMLGGGLGVILILGIGYGTVSYGLEHGRLPGGNSMLVRWQYWHASAQMVGDHPLTGVGPGNFAHNYARYKPDAAPEMVGDPHCFPLSVLSQYGLFGLAGFLAMVMVPICRSTLSVAREGPSTRDEPSSSRRQILTMLAVLVMAMLVLRPILIGAMSDGNGEAWFYVIVAFYVAPAAAFLIGYLLLAAPLAAQRRKEDGPDWTLATTALGCSVLGVLLHNLIDFAIFEPGVWTGLWFVIATLVGAGHQRTARRPAVRSCPPALRVAAVVVALGLAGLYVHYVWQPARSATTKMQQALSAGPFTQVHDLLDEAFAADPLSAAALNLNGRLYLQEYEYGPVKARASLEKAATYFRRAVEVNPVDYKNYEKAGIAYGLLGQNQQAYDWYLGAVERYPGCGRLHLRLGELAEQLDAPEKARERYQRAIEIEDAFRQQFRVMYPEREKVVSRLGDDNYERAKERLGALSQ